MNNNLEFENTDPSPDSIEDNHPRTNYSEGWVQERMFSEKDIREAWENGWKNGRNGETETTSSHTKWFEKNMLRNRTFTKWFEQFKKK
jgi:hypothetical protein